MLEPGVGGAAPTKPKKKTPPYYGPPEAQYGAPNVPATTTVPGDDFWGRMQAAKTAQGAGPFPLPQTQPGGNWSWGNLDIPTILGGDPLYQQLVTFDLASSQTDKAWMHDQLNKLKSYYGSESDPISVFGRIKQSLEDRKLAIGNQLAGHGMLFSGETGYQGNKARLAYLQQEFDAQRQMQQAMDDLARNFAMAEQQRK